MTGVVHTDNAIVLNHKAGDDAVCRALVLNHKAGDDAICRTGMDLDAILLGK